MKRKNKKRKRDIYEDDFDGVDIKDLRIVPKPKWLPSPEEVARELRHTKVTIILDEPTVQFFKQKAKKNGVSYQRMIREVLRKCRDGTQRAA